MPELQLLVVVVGSDQLPSLHQRTSELLRELLELSVATVAGPLHLPAVVLERLAVHLLHARPPDPRLLTVAGVGDGVRW